MKNILTIYKFKLPFQDSKYETIKTSSFISSIKNFLIYEELNGKIENTKQENLYITKILFNGGKINILYYDKIDYYIPLFKLDFYIDGGFNLTNKFIRKLFEISNTVSRGEYIFDINNYYASNINIDFNNIEIYKKSFDKLNNNTLESFLKNTNKNYIEETLKINKDIYNSFIYMIYICYIFYFNSIKMGKSLEELIKITGKSDFIIYNGHIDFQKERVTDLQNINIVQFKKYFLVLEKFFSLFYK